MKIRCFRNNCEHHSLLDTDGCNLLRISLMVTGAGIHCYDFKKKEQQ